MAKVLLTPTIFFTNGYLSMNINRGGSGLFQQKHSNDLNYEHVLENLLDKELIVKCDVFQGTRTPKNNKLSLSYYKQHPSYFQQSESGKQELQVCFF